MASINAFGTAKHQFHSTIQFIARMSFGFLSDTNKAITKQSMISNSSDGKNCNASLPKFKRSPSKLPFGKFASG